MITYKAEYEEKVKELLLAKDKPKAYVRIYGCQQNVSDAERIKTLAVNMGYELCDSPKNASLVVFVTCAVRHSAESKIIGNIGALLGFKERNEDMITVICGCMTQQKHMVDSLKKKFPFIDIIIGTAGAHRLPEFIYRKMTEGKKTRETFDESMDIVEGIPQTREEKFRAFVPIMYGCNNFCSYCIVPYVRGRERSRRSEDVIKDVRQIVADGCKDVTLLGQNVNSYREPDEGFGFPELLRRINAIEGSFKIRFMTSHPKDMSDELLDVIAECDKISKHIHLPLQSGSDRILKLMNRKYTREGYRNLVKKAREKIEGLSLTSDIIVGFPGETEEDFKDTLSLVDEVKYDSLFTFLYSPREGTPAAAMEDQIPVEVKQRRFEELVDLQTKNGFILNEHMKGKEYDVLVDKVKNKVDKDNAFLSSRTDGNKIVEFIGPPSLFGKVVRVRITEPLSWLLKGELVTE